MKKLLLAALLFILPGIALGQTVGIVNGATPIIGGTTGQCVTKSAAGVAAMAGCGTGSLPLSGGTMTGTLALKGVSETTTTAVITANVLTIDLSLGTVFIVSSNANITTFTITNATAASHTFTLYMVGNGTGYTQSWGTTRWANQATGPALTQSADRVDILIFTRPGGGSIWYGMVGGQNM